MRKVFVIALLIITSSLINGNLFAQKINEENKNIYQVNLLIFQNSNIENLNSEYWSIIKQVPKIENATNPELKPSDTSELKEEVLKLEKKNYKIIANLTWETELATKDGTTFHIMAGKLFNGFYQVDGTSINKNHYFDVEAKLIITSEALNSKENTQFEEKGDFKSFQINQSLRLQTDQLGYIYHPAFGILIKITHVSVVDKT